MLLLELFDTVYPFHVRTLGDSDLPAIDGNWLTNDGRPFMARIRCIDRQSRIVEFEFSDESNGMSEYDANGGGDQYRIMGTAFAILGEYAEKYRPSEIEFFVNPFEGARKPIYRRLSNKFVAPLGYSVDVEHANGDNGEEITFRLKGQPRP